MLDTTPLANAIHQLQEALYYHASEMAQKDEKLKNQLRAAAIQAFEFTYELSIKMLRRHLMVTEANPSDAEEYMFQEIIRRGYSLGLLHAELKQWKKFRAYRSATSHTYQQAKAEEVFQAIPEFLAEAIFLLSKLNAAHEQ